MRPGDAVGGDHRVVEWGGRLAFAGEFGGDALKDLGWQLRRDEDAGFSDWPSMSMKPGSDDLAAGIDDLLRGRAVQPPDRGDVAVLDREVAGIPRSAGAVDDVPVADEEVVLRRLGGEDGRGGEDGEGGKDRKEASLVRCGHGPESPQCPSC